FYWDRNQFHEQTDRAATTIVFLPYWQLETRRTLSDDRRVPKWHDARSGLPSELEIPEESRQSGRRLEGEIMRWRRERVVEGNGSAVDRETSALDVSLELNVPPTLAVSAFLDLGISGSQPIPGDADRCELGLARPDIQRQDKLVRHPCWQ